MKFIQKTAAPREYLDWLARANDDWKPSYGILSGEPKRALKRRLIEDQGHICCYCERRLLDGDSHIEHFIPQHLNNGDDVTFENLLCSCMLKRPKRTPAHCGIAKDKWYDPALTVSPLDQNCGTRFLYAGDGRMLASRDGDRGAEETIIKMALNLGNLPSLRAAIIETIIDDTLTPAEQKAFALGMLNPGVGGILPEFFSTIKQYA